MDWQIIITNIIGGLVTAIPIVYALRTSGVDMINKQGRTVAELWDEFEEMKKRFTASEKKYTILLMYFLENVEHMRRHDLTPLPPPDELKSDPEIMRIIMRKRPKDGK